MLVYSARVDHVWQQNLDVPVGCSVEQALAASEFERLFPQVAWRANGVGLFGQRVRPEHRLSHQDRIEIYRELVFDPKESRRRRALHRQRQKQSGDKRNG